MGFKKKKKVKKVKLEGKIQMQNLFTNNYACFIIDFTFKGKIISDNI